MADQTNGYSTVKTRLLLYGENIWAAPVGPKPSWDNGGEVRLSHRKLPQKYSTCRGRRFAKSRLYDSSSTLESTHVYLRPREYTHLNLTPAVRPLCRPGRSHERGVRPRPTNGRRRREDSPPNAAPRLSPYPCDFRQRQGRRRQRRRRLAGLPVRPPTRPSKIEITIRCGGRSKGQDGYEEDNDNRSIEGGGHERMNVHASLQTFHPNDADVCFFAHTIGSVPSKNRSRQAPTINVVQYGTPRKLQCSLEKPEHEMIDSTDRRQRMRCTLSMVRRIGQNWSVHILR